MAGSLSVAFVGNAEPAGKVTGSVRKVAGPRFPNPALANPAFRVTRHKGVGGRGVARTCAVVLPGELLPFRRSHVSGLWLEFLPKVRNSD